MVPRTIQQQLNRLRSRERWLQLLWIAARWLPVLVAALLVACFIDWLVDRRRDTPFVLRLLLLLCQLSLWSAAVIVLARVLGRRPSDAQVALWVEDQVPKFGHRLISAVQLNEPGAATQGMSPELIGAVTREAETETATRDLAQLADARRLGWGARLVLPVVLVVVLLLLLAPATMAALLARQVLGDADIPRSVHVVRKDAEIVWPSGEDVLVRFRVRGEGIADDDTGEVRVDPDGNRPSEYYPLVFESRDDSGEATFLARVSQSSVDFACFAWVKDGRTRKPARVRFEPRPVVQKQEAWVQLPAGVGLRSNSQPFEEPQKGGDIINRLPGSSARVTIEVQKPIVEARVEVLGAPHPWSTASSDGHSETVRRSVMLTLLGNGSKAGGSFPLSTPLRPEFLGALAVGSGGGLPGSVPWAALVASVEDGQLPPESGYRFVVRDRYGFENKDRPRRSIRYGSVEPPEVVLLPELFWKPGDKGSPEEREVEGIPVLQGQRILLAYRCSAAYGLSHALLRYRVIKKGSDSAEESRTPQASDFLPLPLGPPRGAAQNVSKKALEEFFTSPSSDPEKVGGTEGGGRYDFDSMGIPDGEGGLLKLQPGDRIQFYVEVFGRADPDGKPGRSAMREKEVVELKDFLAWLEKKDDQKEKIKQLEDKQRGAIGRPHGEMKPRERPGLRFGDPP